MSGSLLALPVVRPCRREVTTAGRAVECRRLSAFQLPSVRPPFLTPVKMDSIKSKMKSLSEATAEATKRTMIYEEEINRINEIADKYEEQVRAYLAVREIELALS